MLQIGYGSKGKVENGLWCSINYYYFFLIVIYGVLACNSVIAVYNKVLFNSYLSLLDLFFALISHCFRFSLQHPATNL